eukprot:GILI01039135.1.p1 GENE.GILI01039135.1~~GILI01039135.1.p1  ORF type:complete len:229 (+),score=63.75 GILI01039135.1:99-689(+)
MALAKHVTHVHRFSCHPPLPVQPLSAGMMRSYISVARKYEPTVPQSLVDYIVSIYTEMRQNEAEAEKQGYSYTTPRSLLAVLRLSQALARLRCSSEVDMTDVDEALRLINSSRASIMDDEPDKKGVDPMSAIFDIIRDVAARQNKLTVSYDEVEGRVLAKGYSSAQLKDCLDEYESLSIWSVDDTRSNITFLERAR